MIGITFVQEQGEDPARRPEDVRRYNGPRYVALLADVAAGVAVLALVAFSGAGDALYGLVDGPAWWATAPAFAALIVLVSSLARAPITVWRGWVHERRFGFSTHSLAGFLGDQAKAIGVGAVLTAAAMLGLVAAVHAAPSWWPALAAPGAALVVLLFAFVAPLVLEPLFNRFKPLEDRALAAEVAAISERAEVPVRETLVADASRRTRKVNAYVSGLGRTRRVVLFDTLVRQAAPKEVLVVVGHELGHRRFGHVAWGTALGMAGAAAGVLAVWLVVPDPGDPRRVAHVLLLLSVLSLLAAPAQAWVSRRWEYACDRFALELIGGDLGTFESAFAHLSEANLADPDPPRAIYLWLFTHPTVPERIAAARRWAPQAAAAPGTSSP